MPLHYETYWIFRDNYPVKRYIGANAAAKARIYAEALSYNYPGSVVRCSLQRLSEIEVFNIQPKLVEAVKELRDA